ncbi:unnamed protein product [Lepeophtheirus salmonis]|uniref:(salmon louse) hypothetical protein n=1 Tax=Lepeophtheirus salmonis TaxID=72036 RepID=A0A7R8H979_LEPSM|nr:unnamed protein product [Lepeophtheirus salmonis]CAF2950579.1 unnamed protein product [Lepeophtheirus salmonis]
MKGGAISVSQAFCVSYKVEISQFLTPKFSSCLPWCPQIYGKANIRNEEWSGKDWGMMNLLIEPRNPFFGNSVPKKGLEKWSEEKTKMLIPIKYQLSPIINLFTPENTWTNVFEIQCFSPSGCGYDDTCTFEEQCIEDRSSATNYRCEASSWADITNWPAMGTNTVKDPDPPNITWFREHDSDSNGYLSLAELYAHEYPSQGWLGRRYTEAIDKLFGEADLNGDRYVDNGEYIKLHERHPWYSEQIAFLIINSDNDGYLTRGEFFEATKSSPDIQTMNFSYKQLENLVDGLIAIGDDDGDERISFSEYVKMSNDVFVDHFAPKYLKKVFKS